MTCANMIRTMQLFAVAALTGLGVGCSSDSGAGTQNTSVSGAYEALGAQLENCRLSAESCLKTANCDAAKDQACRDDLKSCHASNRAAFDAFGKAIQVCVQDKHTCLSDTASAAGAAADTRSTCRQAFHDCVDGAKPVKPEPNPCLAPLRSCMQDTTQKPLECFQAARSCLLDQLPPRCMIPHRTAGTGGSAPVAGSGE